MTLRPLALAFCVLLATASVGSGQTAPERALVDEIRALQAAAAADPSNAPALARLSQAYAMANQPGAALSAIEGALAVDRGNPAYLRSRATLATWAGRYDRARDSYQQLSKLQALDVEARLNYARVSAWAGDTDTAAGEYRKLLAERPDLSEAWLELARTESWRGNYAAAFDTLDAYRSRFGESQASLKALAGLMASAGRPTRAQALLTPLLAASPQDDELHLTRTVTLARQQRAREAFASLATLRGIATDPIAIRTAERVLRAELASSAEPHASFYSDSDRLNVQRFAPAVTVALSSGTRVTGGYDRTRLAAAAGSGLEGLDGSLLAHVTQIGAGLSQKAGPVSLTGRLGQARIDGRTRTTYGAAIQVRPVDTLTLSAERLEGLFVISPRTVSLGMTQVAHRVQADWAVGMRYHLALDAVHRSLSDGNERLEVIVSPRRSVARTTRFNLDMGVSAYRLETTRDLENGYYDPRRYEHYAATAFPYLKVDENVGVALSLAAGVQRDTTSASFRFGATVSGEATFGIYAPWLLKVHSSATINQRLESGAFRGFGGGVTLVRRF